MNNDSFADVERRIAGKTGGFVGRGGVSRSIERPASVARWLVSLALALVAAWTVLYAVPAFGGLLAATAVGIGALAAVPWAAITLGTRVTERIE